MKWNEGEGINKEFEMWQDELNVRTLHLKMTVRFDSDRIESVLNDIDNLKDIVL